MIAMVVKMIKPEIAKILRGASEGGGSSAAMASSTLGAATWFKLSCVTLNPRIQHVMLSCNAIIFSRKIMLIIKNSLLEAFDAVLTQMLSHGG